VKKPVSYPFYTSLRFRFGLIFGFAFLCFLLITGLLLYSNVKTQFEKSFAARLKAQGSLLLQETEVSPITIPFPASGEHFSLVYLANAKADTLFNNLPEPVSHFGKNANSGLWRSVALERKLETGGVLRIVYVLPATELNEDIRNLQVILFLYFPLAFLAALMAGYLLSGFLLRPIENIVSKADQSSLQGRIHLLEEPEVRDELHKLTISLNRMLDRIEKQSQYQNAFFASASHELRTPLSVMLTELQTLQKEQLPPDIRLVISNQTTEVQRLGKLVNDFLLLSQLKAGSLTLTHSNVNLPEVLIGLLDRIADRARRNTQTFKIDLIPENADFEIYTDTSLLITMLLNLLENAVKHGKPDSAIVVRVEKMQDRLILTLRNTVTNRITDPDTLTHEFNRQDHQIDGFGLGLWIVAKLSETIGAHFEIQYDHPHFTALVTFEEVMNRAQS